MLIEQESNNEHFQEPFSEYGAVILQSGIPVRLKDGGGQGDWVRVPQPTAGEEGTVLTVQPSLSVDWTLPQLRIAVADISNATLRTTNPTTLVQAQGSNTLIVPINVVHMHLYGGTNAWTSMGVPGIAYNNNASTRVVLNSAVFTSVQSHQRSQAITQLSETFGTTVNLPITFNMDAGGVGNAANNNTARVYITYYVVDV